LADTLKHRHTDLLVQRLLESFDVRTMDLQEL